MKTRESVKRVTHLSLRITNYVKDLWASTNCVICNFSRQRKFAARKLSNPRLLKIHFHTFRHWKATMEYQRTKDILYVMIMLGHKSIQNTIVYTQMV